MENNKKVKELDIIKEIFNILGIKINAKVIDITNGKEMSIDEFKEYLEKELCSHCEDCDECVKNETRDTKEFISRDETMEVLNKIVHTLNNVTTSREMALAKTKIEEAIMWLEKDDKKDTSL